MKINDHNNSLKGLISIIGVISTSFLLSLPALALLQSKTTATSLVLEDEQLLAQDSSGDNSGDDSGDDSGDNSGDNDNGGSDDSDNGGDSDDSDNSDNGSDSDSNDSANGTADDGDAGENFRTRGDSAGGAPYVGVGESMDDEDSQPQ